MKGYYIGIDVGSVSTNLVALDDQLNVANFLYLRTMGRPVETIQEGMTRLAKELEHPEVLGVGTTGSGRHLAAVMTGADVVKNEITAQATGTLHFLPGVRTIFEIGGQDSKLILLQDGVVVDFAMNTVCAAGTGSFLDQQALRLQIPIEEFGRRAVRSSNPVTIAGRCGVFAESDMIHKQQMGCPLDDIIAGLCEALARNFLSNLAKGKKVEGPIAFQGGVAANQGMRQAFEKLVGQEITVPPYYNVMGAVGAALLAAESLKGNSGTRFRGFEFVNDGHFTTKSMQCSGCPNCCEVVSIQRDEEILSYSGDRCRRWEATLSRRREMVH